MQWHTRPQRSALEPAPARSSSRSSARHSRRREARSARTPPMMRRRTKQGRACKFLHAFRTLLYRGTLLPGVLREAPGAARTRTWSSGSVLVSSMRTRWDAGTSGPTWPRFGDGWDVWVGGVVGWVRGWGGVGYGGGIQLYLGMVGRWGRRVSIPLRGRLWSEACCVTCMLCLG